MQACPYDALYIDPDTHTAAKCNYCAHRIDLGLEPACVNVCPEHAIISGDMDNPQSEISQLLAQEEVTVRKEEKKTAPNLFYINGDAASLVPEQTERSDDYVWSAQTRGVGHYARAAEKLAWSNEDVVQELLKRETTQPAVPVARPQKSVAVLMEGGVTSKLAYDIPDKGILWGWEVPAYVLTKAISSGVSIVFALALILGIVDPLAGLWSVLTSLGFLMLTGVLLVMDLDRPDRFLYVLLRPQWRSWLTRGGYAITVFGAVLAAQFLATLLGAHGFATIMAYLCLPVAILVAVYTAFLFAQAKGRDFWESKLLSWHMLVHSVMAGAAMMILLQYFGLIEISDSGYSVIVMTGAILANLVILFAEFRMKHKTHDAIRTAGMIFHGRYALQFWGGGVLLGNVLPLLFIWLLGVNSVQIGAALAVLAGIYLVDRIWVEAPQRIPLS
jgi:formate-dependent nitrite reductase membrane component NrfD